MTYTREQYLNAAKVMTQMALARLERGDDSAMYGLAIALRNLEQARRMPAEEVVRL